MPRTKSRRSRRNPWPAKYKTMGAKYDDCVASVGPGYNPYAVCAVAFKRKMGTKAFGNMLSARRRVTKQNPRRRSAARRNPWHRDYSGKLYLERVYLNQGGYTSQGRYFGIGAPLYRFYARDEEIDGYVRGATREHAIAAILKDYPNARFFGPVKLRSRFTVGRSNPRRKTRRRR